LAHLGSAACCNQCPLTDSKQTLTSPLASGREAGARTIDKALADMKAGRLSLANEGVGFESFKAIVGYGDWAQLEDKFGR
jgi:hypothetical protein